MRKLVQLLNLVLRDQRGATAIEYGLIAALVCLALVTAVTDFGITVMNIWNFVADEVLEA